MLTEGLLARRQVGSGAERSLACWRDDKSAAGRTTVLAHWRDVKSAAGQTMPLGRLCVGDASSKCKEAGGAQDCIFHDGDDDEDRGSCRGPFSRTPWKGWGRGWTASLILCSLTRWRPWEEEQLRRLESRTSSSTKAHMVAAVCIVVAVVLGGGGVKNVWRG